MKKQRVNGGCHCGAVRFEAELDLASGGFRCNCSICTKLGPFVTSVATEAFSLRSGQDQLSEYVFEPRHVQRFFCKTCGVLCFARITLPEGVQIGINLNALESIEIKDIPAVYFDGRHDQYEPRPEPQPILTRGA